MKKWLLLLLIFGCSDRNTVYMEGYNAGYNAGYKVAMGKITQALSEEKPAYYWVPMAKIGYLIAQLEILEITSEHE